MNLLCPNCQKMLTVPDQYSGQTMKCPQCTGTFTVPGAPMPGFESAPVTSRFPSPGPGFAPDNAATSPAAGHQHAFSMSLRLGYLNFLAPVALVVVFILMFLPWVE